MPDDLTIEIALFRLKPDASESSFLGASEAIMPALTSLTGYISRQLFKGDDGQWIDIVSWRSRDDALQAAAHVTDLPGTAAFVALIDEGSVTMLHGERAQTYAATVPARNWQ